MLEESKMDKKSLNRLSQPQSRVSAVDCKKSADSTHKPWPRNNKKREGPVGAPKNEQYRNRNTLPSQRGRGQIDRRARARGPTNFSMGGMENTRVEDDDEPEVGSLVKPGSKKQNFNHLLNFTYPHLELKGGVGPQRRYTQHRVFHKHDHGLYLRSYCQFVVKEDGDYKVNSLDPDVPLKWDQIEEIVVRSTGRSECPICLGAPVAGRVGLCGHVFCWACVLHYSDVHEKQPPPCPVCTMPLKVGDMKPTRMLQWDPPAEEIKMRLVRRLRGSTVVEVAPPRGQLTESEAKCVLPLGDINNAPYSKLFAASKQQVQEIVARDRKEIENQIFAEIDTTEIVYLEQALKMLNLKEEKINAQPNNHRHVEEPSKEVPIVYEKHVVNEKKLDWFDMSDEGAACFDAIQEQREIKSEVKSDLNPEAREFNINKENQSEEFPLIECSSTSDNEQNSDSLTLTDIDKQNKAKYFYFYQAEDGQQVFLHNLNVRMLNASWGNLAAAPSVIHGRVLHRETLSVTEQARKHMPCTLHLPIHCAFDLVELDLQPPHVTKTALNRFTEELDRRARVRARHEREERRRERAYLRSMEGPQKPDISSEVLFPPAPPSYGSPPLSEPAFLPPFDEASPSTSNATPPSGLSFAKMASTSGTWRVRKAPTAPPPLPLPAEDEASAPRTLNLSDAIEAAFQAAPSPSPTGKKNKKSKQKVLFATGINRNA